MPINSRDGHFATLASYWIPIGRAYAELKLLVNQHSGAGEGASEEPSIADEAPLESL